MYRAAHLAPASCDRIDRERGVVLVDGVDRSTSCQPYDAFVRSLDDEVAVALVAVPTRGT
jgi:hypothetical protein